MVLYIITKQILLNKCCFFFCFLFIKESWKKFQTL